MIVDLIVDVLYPDGSSMRQTLSLLQWIRIRLFGKTFMFTVGEDNVYLTRCECCNKYVLVKFDE